MNAGEVQITTTVLSHRGAVRPYNQDSVVAGAALFEGLDAQTPYQVSWTVRAPSIIVVADGLGGEAAGEVASRYAARRLQQLTPQLVDPPSLEKALSQISDEIWAEGQSDPAHRGMATTVVGLLISDVATCWFNVGDSPLLKLDGGYAGYLSEADSPRVPFGEPGADVVTTSLVTQVLGNPPDTPIVPHVGDDKPAPDQRYLLCSDGLTNHVDPAQIERILSDNTDDDQQAVLTLWATAMNAGGTDNISIALVRRQAKP
jgi:PPM family protein phosphatase